LPAARFLWNLAKASLVAATGLQALSGWSGSAQESGTGSGGRLLFRKHGVAELLGGRKRPDWNLV
jgi:hypothetical protein